MDDNTTTDGGTAADFGTDADGVLLNRLPGSGERLLGGASGADLPDFDVPPGDPTGGDAGEIPRTGARGRSVRSPAPSSPTAVYPPDVPSTPSLGYSASPPPTYSPGAFIPGYPTRGKSRARSATPYPLRRQDPATTSHGTSPATPYPLLPQDPVPTSRDTPPATPARRIRARRVAIAVVAGLALIGGSAFINDHHSPPADVPVAPAEPPAPGPYGTVWSDAIPADPVDTIPPLVSFGDTIVYLSRPAAGSGIVTAVDLAAGEVLWSAPITQTLTAIYGDSTVIVVNGPITMFVYNPADGTSLGELTTPGTLELLWAGEGKALTSDGRDLCMRAAADLNTCLWTAPDAGRVFDGPVFDDGRLVNTGAGVVDATTGKPVSFGSDAGRPDPTGSVSYLGSPNTVLFRVVLLFAHNPGLYTFQVWDAATDQAVSPPVTGDSVVADAASRTMIVLNGTHESDAVTTTGLAAYDVDTGAALWQTPVSPIAEYLRFFEFLGGHFLWTDPRSTGATAYDPRTGAIAWQVRDPGEWTIGNGQLYRWGAQDWAQYDPVSGQIITRLAPPSKANYISLLGTPNHVIAYSPYGGLWVLEQ